MVSARNRADALVLVAQSAAGRVLDLPAGAGSDSAALQKLGREVVSLDLFPPAAGEGGLRWIRADANRRLPFRDSAFTCVLSREGIEHLENQAGFIRECARVLRPAGLIVITTPNVLHLSARLSQLLTGQRSMRRGLANEVQTLRAVRGGYRYHGHIFLVDYFRLRYLLRLAGFQQLEVHTDRYSPTAIALGLQVPLMYAATAWSVFSAVRRAKRRGHSPTPAPVIAEIRRHVFSPAMLFGKRMIIAARKPAAGPEQGQ